MIVRSERPSSIVRRQPQFAKKNSATSVGSRSAAPAGRMIVRSERPSSIVRRQPQFAKKNSATSVGSRSAAPAAPARVSLLAKRASRARMGRQNRLMRRPAPPTSAFAADRPPAQTLVNKAELLYIKQRVSYFLSPFSRR
jgi:hypothetical protein